MQYKKSVFRSLAMVTQLGLSVITPVFLCVFIGYQIDSRFGTKWMIPLLILGILAGGRCAWMMAVKVLEAERREDEMLRQERKSAGVRAGISKPKQPSRIQVSSLAQDESESGSRGSDAGHDTEIGTDDHAGKTVNGDK